MTPGARGRYCLIHSWTRVAGNVAPAPDRVAESVAPATGADGRRPADRRPLLSSVPQAAVATTRASTTAVVPPQRLLMGGPYRWQSSGPWTAGEHRVNGNPIGPGLGEPGTSPVR